MFDLHTISFLLIFIAAGLVKGVTGMGLPTVAMGLLGLLMPPQAAALSSGLSVVPAGAGDRADRPGMAGLNPLAAGNVLHIVLTGVLVDL